MGEGQQEIEKRSNAGMGRAIGDYFRGTIESGNQSGNGEIDTDSHKFCHDDRAENTKPGTLFSPVILPGAQILADERGKGHGETGDRQETEALDLGVGAASCYRHLAKLVDVGLHHHIGQGDDGILKSGRQSVGDDLLKHRQVETNLSDIHTIGLRTLAGKAVET